MSKYSLNLFKTAVSLLPFSVRDFLKFFINAITVSLGKIQSFFQAYKNKINWQLSYTGQVFSLEKMLNDFLELDPQTITIVDGVSTLGLYFYQTEEQKPVLFSTQLFTDYQNWNLSGFLVLIPQNIADDDTVNQIEALVNQYKIAGTTYKIIEN